MTGAVPARRALKAMLASEVLEGPVIDEAGALVAMTPVPLGDGESGDMIGFHIERLLDSRLLIQGMSGAGKSYLLRRLLETTAGLIQQVVLDPEGEFGSLAECYGHHAIDASRLDPEALGQAAHRARVHRLSLWVDLSQLERGPQMAAAAAVLSALVLAPGDHWHPCLVAVDEAHLFAPQSGGGASRNERRRSLDAVADLMGRGRKRGLCGVLATQRLVNLAKSVASEAGNVLIGKNAIELDIARAAQAIGWTARKAQDRLPGLPPGAFVAVGPAFTHSPAIVQVGPVRTRHRGSTPRLGPPPARRDDGAALLEIDDLHAETEVRAAAAQSGFDPREASVIRAFARHPASVVAMRIYGEVRQVKPLSILVARLGPRLGLKEAAIAEGLSLLDDYGLVRFAVAHAGRTVEAT